MKLLLRQQALLLVAASIIFFTGLGGCGFFNDGESTMAGSVLEMFRGRAWVVPTFNGVVETDHPILAYWFMRISFGFFGIREFTARLPSSVLAVGTTLLTYHLGRKLYSSSIGFLAGFIVCTCLTISVFGRSATPDSTQVFFDVLTLTCYVWVIARQRGGKFNGNPLVMDAPETTTQVALPDAALPDEVSKVPAIVHKQLKPLVPARWQLAVPMFAAMGFATLASGLAGFGWPLLTIFLFLLLTVRAEDLSEQRLKSPSGPKLRRWLITIGQIFRPRPILEVGRHLNLLIGIGIVVVIAAPWYLAVGAMTKGIWLREFFWDQTFNRFEDLRSSLVWFLLYVVYDPFLVLACVFPWAVFLPVAIYQLRERLTDDAAAWPQSDRLLACWIGVWLLEFLVFGAEMPNFVVRICPALALILARYLDDWERDEGDSGAYSFNICCKALGAVGAVMVVGFYVASYLYFSGEGWIGLIGAVPLIGAFVAIKFLDGDRRQRVMQTIMTTAFVIAVLIVGVAPLRIARFQDSPLFVADARRSAGSNDIEIATYAYFEPSIVYYAGKNVRRLTTTREAAEFIGSHSHAFIVTPANKHNELRDELQSDVAELSRHRNFLGREELILLGRQ